MYTRRTFVVFSDDDETNELYYSLKTDRIMFRVSFQSMGIWNTSKGFW